MTEFPYTQVTGKLKTLFDKVQQVGKPDIVDKKWLASIGLKASNDATLIPVLRFVGFVDQSGKPTDRWVSYRNKSNGKIVMAEAIRDGYSELFKTYEDAYQRDDTELKSYFATRSTAGAQVISKIVTTFKSMCTLADFGATSPTNQSVLNAKPLATAWSESPELATNTQLSGTGLTINLNIQLTLPATTDETVYSKLFAAMKEYLLS